MTTAIPAAKLSKLSTLDLIAQYDLAVLKRGYRPQYNGQTGKPTPLSRRINRIVDMISARADAGDVAALLWFAAA